MTIEAMKQALEALNTGNNEVLPEDYGQMVSEAITALRAAIEETEKQEPVAWMWADGTITTDPDRADGTWTPLYIAPRQWQSLTDEDIAEAGQLNVESERMLPYSFARAIEAKLKEKNT